jgi:hypothetical protein
MIIKETEPVVLHTTEVHAAIVAIVFLISRSPADDPNALVNAAETGRLQGALEASQSASSSIADQANSAADRAASAADRAADSASKAVTSPPQITVQIPSSPPAAEPVQ